MTSEGFIENSWTNLDVNIKGGAITQKTTCKYVNRKLLRICHKKRKSWMQMNSKQITKRTMMLLSNDENTTTIIGSIDEIVTQLLTSFDHAQKWDNKGPSTNGQNMFQDISKVANSSVSNHFIPTRGVKIKVT